MKIHWAFLKKPSVIVGAVILFFVLLFMLNRGPKATAGNTVVQTGPTDAQVAAQTQLAMATMSAGLQGQAIQLDYAKSQDNNATAIALATMQTTLGVDQLAAQQEIANRTIDAQTHGLDLQYQTSHDQIVAGAQSIAEQFQYGLASQAITANTQLQLSADQLAGFKYEIGANLVTSLAGKNKYSSIALPAFFNQTNGSSGQSGTTYSFGTAGVLH